MIACKKCGEEATTWLLDDGKRLSCQCLHCGSGVTDYIRVKTLGLPIADGRRPPLYHWSLATRPPKI